MPKIREFSQELVREVFHGRYQIQEELGAGARTLVFRAVDLHAGRDVSVKVLWRQGRGQRLLNYLEFQRQVRAVQKVSHPRVAAVLAYERTSSAVVLVEEFFPGLLLSQIPSGNILPAPVVTAILVQAAEALEPFHEIGLYHHRLSPSNLLLTGASPEKLPENGGEIDVRILDFGHVLLTAPSLTGEEPAADFAYTAPERAECCRSFPTAGPTSTLWGSSLSGSWPGGFRSMRPTRGSTCTGSWPRTRRPSAPWLPG
jgi:serine/threonine protein kinase